MYQFQHKFKTCLTTFPLDLCTVYNDRWKTFISANTRKCLLHLEVPRAERTWHIKRISHFLLRHAHLDVQKVHATSLQNKTHFPSSVATCQCPYNT